MKFATAIALCALCAELATAAGGRAPISEVNFSVKSQAKPYVAESQIVQEEAVFVAEYSDAQSGELVEGQVLLSMDGHKLAVTKIDTKTRRTLTLSYLEVIVPSFEKAFYFETRDFEQIRKLLDLNLTGTIDLLLTKDGRMAPWVRVFTATDSFKAAYSSFESRAEKPFYNVVEAPHEVQIIEEGPAALELRLQMIARAKHSIDVEYYIFETDQAGRLVVQALAKKAREGVKVRILVDDSPFGRGLTSYHAYALADLGADMRLYNSSTVFNFWQSRNHRKMLVIDGIEALTGGRNIGNEYFGLSEDHQFNDRDIHVVGPVVATMQKSFEAFFSSPLSVGLGGPSSDPEWELGRLELVKEATEIFVETARDAEFRRRVQVQGEATLNSLRTFHPTKVTFASDRPGSGSRTRIVSHALFSRMSKVRKTLVVEAPYFILQDSEIAMIRDIVEKGASVHVISNSKFSTGVGLGKMVAYVIEAKAKYLSKLDLVNFNGYSGNPTAYDKVVASKKPDDYRWELHGKSMLFDSTTMMIGTYNTDPRSKNFNSELVLLLEGDADLIAYQERHLSGKVWQSHNMGYDGKYIHSDWVKLREPETLMAGFLHFLFHGLLVDNL